jgi:hypothetical protein
MVVDWLLERIYDLTFFVIACKIEELIEWTAPLSYACGKSAVGFHRGIEAYDAYADACKSLVLFCLVTGKRAARISTSICLLLPF